MTRLVKQVLTPIVGRLGTALSGYLIAQGLPENHASALVVAVGVCLGLAFDASVIVIAKRRTTR
ncbi:hypothetical protein [Flyfo microvirus Tbat2_95]|nr:hypothetical protein [Flyfo microvirus Tbat2_95]